MKTLIFQDDFCTIKKLLGTLLGKLSGTLLANAQSFLIRFIASVNILKLISLSPFPPTS